MPLVDFVCDHGDRPRLAARALDAPKAAPTVVTVPWCKDTKGTRRPHFAPGRTPERLRSGQRGR